MIFGIVFTATRVNLNRLDSELQFRGDAHVALERVLRDPEVGAALRCGPVYVPNHKLIPDVRWILDRAQGRRPRALTPTGSGPRAAAWRSSCTSASRCSSQALVTDADEPLDNLPPPGFTRAASSQYYAAYVSC